MLRPSRVCVHVPSYNHREFLPAAIESVLAQTYQDFHVVIVDDASTDGSPEVIRKYAARHPERITAIINERNLGIPRRLNVALGHCQSEYFSYLDGDDLWLPDALESLVRALEARPEAGLAYGDIEWFDGATGRALRRYSELNPPASGEIFEELVRRGCFIGATAVMLRRTALRDTKVSLSDPPFQVASDYYLWLSIAARHPAVYVPRVLGRHRRHAACASLGCDWTREARLSLEHLLARCPELGGSLAAILLRERELREAELRESRAVVRSYHQIMNRPSVRLYRKLKRLLRWPGRRPEPPEGTEPPR
jgi:glycosyltransferase involved in cell wall biosynthesis